MKLRVLILSPFHGHSSHAAWAKGYREHSQHEIVLATLPDRAWAWRLKGGSEALAKLAADAGPVDALLATSLTSLDSFFGLCRRTPLATVPAVYYMHENQLTYPIRPGGKRDSQLVLRQFHSQLTADAVWWNSDFNRRSWLKKLPNFLKRFPDQQGVERCGELEAKSRVMPVGLSLPAVTPLCDSPLRHRLIWSQRWEWEKGIDRFEALLRKFEPEIPFEVALLGPVSQGEASRRRGLENLMGDKLVHSGWCEREQYQELVMSGTFTVSVARHEFFGISVLEAAAQGVVPFLPRELSYPELIPEDLHPQLLYNSLKELYRKVKGFLSHPVDQGLRRRVREVAYNYDWSKVAPMYDRALEELVRSGK